MEMAKFLQETMGEMSLDLKKIDAINADEFIHFMDKVRSSCPCLCPLFSFSYFHCTGQSWREGHKQRDPYVCKTL